MEWGNTANSIVAILLKYDASSCYIRWLNLSCFHLALVKEGIGYSRAAESTLGPVSRDLFKLRILGRGETSREIAFFRIKIEYYFMGCDFNLRPTLCCVLGD